LGRRRRERDPAAEAVGMDQGQISRGLAELVAAKTGCQDANPRDIREVLSA